jgi:hypothetical protein
MFLNPLIISFIEESSDKLIDLKWQKYLYMKEQLKLKLRN